MRAHDHARRDAKRAAEEMRRAMARLGSLLEFADAYQRRALGAPRRDPRRRIQITMRKLDELTRAYQAARFREEWWELAMRAARSPSRRR